MAEATLPTTHNEPSSNQVPGRTREVPLDDVLAKIGYGWFHSRMLFIAGVGFAAAAMEIVLSAFLLTELRAAWGNSEWELAALPTASSCGSVIGELFWGPFADVYGRRPAFLVTVLIVAVFGICSAFASNIWWLIACRGLVGFGYGGNIAVDFAMFSEFLPTANRPQLLILMSMFWPVGQLGCCILAWVLIPRFGWRSFVFGCAIPTVIVGLLRPLIPESPRWLLLHNLKDEATEVVRKMARFNRLQPEDVGLSDGVVLTLEAHTIECHRFDGRANVMSLFSSSLRSTTTGVVLVGVCLHALGYGLLTLMPTLLEERGLPKETGYHFMIVNSLAQFPGVICAGVASLYIGQLLPLKICLPVAALALVGFGTVKSTTALKVCTAISCMFLEGMYALVHTYVPQVYPTELRSTAIGATSAVSSVLTVFIPFVFASIIGGDLDNSLTPVIFVLVTVCLVGGIGACVFLHIETQGRDLDDRVKDIKD